MVNYGGLMFAVYQQSNWHRHTK